MAMEIDSRDYRVLDCERHGTVTVPDGDFSGICDVCYFTESVMAYDVEWNERAMGCVCAEDAPDCEWYKR